MDFSHMPLFVPLTIMLVIGWVVRPWMFGPLEHAAADKHSPVQFTLADALCLLVLLQIASSMLHWEGRNEALTALLPSDIMFCVLIPIVWWSLVRMLSRAGIRATWQRCVVLAVVVPVTGIGVLAVAFVPSAVLDLFLDRSNVSRDIRILLAGVVLPGVIYRLGHFTRAIVASATEE
jgi:hypothetical protein